jgi:molybdopterin-guanine dinucleotide biosynthesis protein A
VSTGSGPTAPRDPTPATEPTEPTEPWDGAVLCGGRSRRMGRDKALLVVEGETMVARVVRALGQAGARRIAAVGGDLPGIRAALAGEPAVALVADATPDEGPLGGVLTALGSLDAPIVLVLACDLVAPSSAAMAGTVAALAADPAAHLAAPLTASRNLGTTRRNPRAPAEVSPGEGEEGEEDGEGAGGGQVEWLHAAWRRSARPALADRFAAGERAIHRAVADGRLVVRPVPGVDPGSLADADTPADLRPRGHYGAPHGPRRSRDRR